VLADAEVQVAAGGVARLELAGTLELERRLGRGVEIRGAADEPGIACRNRVEHFAAGLAGGHPFRVGLESRDIRVPARGQIAALHGL